jgi:hypothetical protein
MIDNKALSSSTYYWYSTVITLYRIESATHLYTRIHVPSDSAAGLIKYTDVKVHDVQSRRGRTAITGRLHAPIWRG